LGFSQDNGRKLENLVYQQLRRKNDEIYYFKGKKECDFVARDKSQAIQVIQVCFDLSLDNKEREIAGLLEAMDFFELKLGTIITFNQQEEFVLNEKTIEVIPAHLYLYQ